MNLRQKKKLEHQKSNTKVSGKKLKKYKKKSLLFVLGIISLGILSTMGVSFAVLSLVISGDELVGLTLGTFDVTLHDGEVINLDNIYPMSDAHGMHQNSYSFSIENTGSVASAYRLVLETDSSLDQSEIIPLHYMKIAIKENDGTYSTPTLLSDIGNGLYIVNNEILNPLDTVSYEIKLWLDESAGNDMMGRVYKARLKVEAVQLIDGYYIDNQAPIIALNGDYVVNLEQGSLYMDAGVSSVNDDTDSIEVNEVETGYKSCDVSGVCIDIANIDTNVVGMYQIYYEVSDSSLNKGIAVRNVNIHLKDTTGPVLTLIGDEPVMHEMETSYIDPGYTAIDDIDGDITGNVVVIDVVNINLEGSYIIKYIVGDSSGNYSIASRTVVVYDSFRPNKPELIGDMIPVVYDDNQSEWVKADLSTEWYDYDIQMWANAVTVTATNRESLVNSSPGTVIPMNDINTMFVWIPRYSYTLGNTYGYQGYGGSTPTVSTPGAFDIKFVDDDVTELGTGEYTGSTVENWYTSSAFCWGNSCDNPSTRSSDENRELSGIWIAKFETSTTGSTTSNTIQQPIVKPNVTSWNYVILSNALPSVLQYMNNGNGNTIYGFSGNTYNTHVVKNTEWGAMAYLSQSKYGKYGNPNYSGSNKEIAINNCSSLVTGIGGDTVSATVSTASCSTNFYDTLLGQAASTTGNIYGIYDTSGGLMEIVMGNMQDSAGNFYSSNAGFTSAPEKKYYNSYVYGTNSSDFSRRILGDATEQVSGFYDDINLFPYQSLSWFVRGGYHTSSVASGIFFFGTSSGSSGSIGGFRISIIP